MTIEYRCNKCGKTYRKEEVKEYGIKHICRYCMKVFIWNSLDKIRFVDWDACDTNVICATYEFMKSLDEITKDKRVLYEG